MDIRAILPREVTEACNTVACDLIKHTHTQCLSVNTDWMLEKLFC